MKRYSYQIGRANPDTHQPKPNSLTQDKETDLDIADKRT